MQDYRAYTIGPDGHVIDRFEFFAADDEAAKRQAQQYVDGHDVELWHRERKVAEFKHGK
jgi:hypothetical protein